MKIASIVVAYCPDVAEVVRNTMSYANECDLVIVWDNTPGVANDWSQLYALGDRLRVCANGENIGLASAYNKGIDMAVECGCSHLMTMDQDSCFENFVVLKQYVIGYEGQEYGMFCPPINNPNVPKDEVCVLNDAAQSGCIFSLDMIKKIGRFRDDFFIGMVDVEMQLKAAEKGYKVAQIGGCNLVHQIGSCRRVKRFGRSFQVSDYGPLRHYYDSRNRILMWKEFPYDYTFSLKMRHFRGRLSVCMRILLAEDNKLNKVWAIVGGSFWGLLGIAKPYK